MFVLEKDRHTHTDRQTKLTIARILEVGGRFRRQKKTFGIFLQFIFSSQMKPRTNNVFSGVFQVAGANR